MSMRHNTVYPKRYLVSTGSIITGFVFYGPFKEYDKALLWKTHNLHVGTQCRIVEMFDVAEHWGREDDG